MIPVALTIVAALGAVIMALGITGHLPLYAVAIGLADIATVCVVGVLCCLCRPQPPPIQHTRILVAPDPLSEAEIIYDTLRMEIFPRLNGDDLGRASQVCHMWCAAAYDDLLWKELWVSEHGTETLSPEFESYLIAFQYIRTIQARYSRGTVIPRPLGEKSSSIHLSGDTLCTEQISSFGFSNLTFRDLKTKRELITYRAAPSSPIDVIRQGNHLFCLFDESLVFGLNIL